VAFPKSSSCRLSRDSQEIYDSYQLTSSSMFLYCDCIGMFAPGIVGLCMASLILVGVGDSPESTGFPPVEIVKEKKDTQSPAGNTTPEKPKESLIDLLVNDCLKYAEPHAYIYIIK
jgi:sugar phosphate permease